MDETARELASALGIPCRLARLLTARGLQSREEAERFLHPSLDQLHSPMLMLGMREAVERLERAIAQQEKLLIYGDYDVDGTAATVILKTVVELLGGHCEYHVPHRLQEGYGMRDEVIERAATSGVRLIVSVDTGIRAFAAAETAARCGVDLIVTDHHLLEQQGEVPRALAVLNPNQPDCGYPAKDLSGAGVAFKVAQALLERAGRARLVPSFLKIAALATIADAVPLVEENRVIAALGLAGLEHVVNPGLRALLEVCDLGGRAPTATEIAFRVAPRINAAGRMDVAREVVELFTVKDATRAKQLAVRLDQLNTARQSEEQRILQEVLQQIEQREELREASCLVVDGEGWHRGVIGICAARVVERFGRPALVISREGEEAHGSGRSVEGFHLLDALESVGDLLLKFGGHAHAVGFSLRTENLPELRRRLDAYAQPQLAALTSVAPQLDYDGELELDEITPRFWEQLRRLEPFGVGNPEPRFMTRAAQLLGEPRILKEKHLKLRLKREADGAMTRAMDALGWRMAHRLEQEPLHGGDRVDLLFRIEQNTNREFGGGLQLVLSDFRLAEGN